jgi:capsular exopolysaccharide synthesis family protein
MSALRAILAPKLENGAKVLQVTSAREGEGTTLVAAGLGIALAQAQCATLLVDAHLSAPSLARTMGHGPSAGLVEVLSKKAANVPGVIFETPVRNLYLLPAGGMTRDALALLNDPRFKHLIDELRARFDRIVIDSAPVLASAEALLAAVACDQTLVVVDSGATRVRDAEEMARMVASFRTEFAGAVLNRYPPLARGRRAAANPARRAPAARRAAPQESPWGASGAAQALEEPAHEVN